MHVEVRPALRLAALLLGLVASSAAPAVDWLLRPPTATLTSSYKSDREKRDGPSIDRDRETLTSRSKLEVKTDGWVYHPALVIFDVDLRPEYESTTERVRFDEATEDKVKFLGMSINSTWLQFKPYTLHLSADRDRTTFQSQLTSDTTTTRSSYLAALELKYDVLPTTFSIERREESTQGTIDTSRIAHTFKIDSRKKTERTRSFLHTAYEIEDRNANAEKSNATRVNFNAGNSFEIRQGRVLSSSVGYANSDTSNVGSTSNASASTRFSVQHRKNLRSWYGVGYRESNTTDQFDRTLDADMGFEHKLYENLVTHLGLEANKNDTTQGKIDSYRGNLSFDYERRLPWRGSSVHANLTRSMLLEDDKRQGQVSNTGQPVVLSGLNLIQLPDQNIIDSTLRVFTADESFEFTRGIDFVVVDQGGGFIAIGRTITGAIANGATVSVRYDYDPDPPAKTLTNTLGYSLGVTVAGLTVSYARGESHERLLSGTPPERPATSESDRISIAYRRGWSSTALTYESRQSSSAPGEQWSASQGIQTGSWRGLSLSLQGSYSGHRQSDTNQFNIDSDISGSLRWAAARNTTLLVNAFSRTSTGDTRNTEDRGVLAELSLRYGAWKPTITFRNSTQTDLDAEQTESRTTLFIEIVRDFDFKRWRRRR